MQNATTQEATMSMPKANPRPTTDLSSKQNSFLSALATCDRTVRQVMDERGISSVELARWMSVSKFRRQIADEQAHAVVWQRLERKHSRRHATETIARVARGQEVGADTRLSLQAAIHVVNTSKRRKSELAVVAPLVMHDESTTRQLLDVIGQADTPRDTH